MEILEYLLLFLKVLNIILFLGGFISMVFFSENGFIKPISYKIQYICFCLIIINTVIASSIKIKSIDYQMMFGMAIVWVALTVIYTLRHFINPVIKRSKNKIITDKEEGKIVLSNKKNNL